MLVLVGLWVLTGLAWVLTVMGMFSIGIVVAPFAVALLVLAVLRTSRRPGGWWSLAGLGFALAIGLGWLGWVLATSGPAEMACSGSSNGPTTCTSDGAVVDPNVIEWATATPWFVAAAVLGVASLAALAHLPAAAASTRSSAAGVGR